MGQFRESILYFENALNFCTLASEQAGSILYYIAYAEFNLSEFENAIQRLDKIKIADKQTLSYSYQLRAAALAKLGKIDESTSKRSEDVSRPN